MNHWTERIIIRGNCSGIRTVYILCWIQQILPHIPFFNHMLRKLHLSWRKGKKGMVVKSLINWNI